MEVKGDDTTEKKGVAVRVGVGVSVGGDRWLARRHSVRRVKSWMGCSNRIGEQGRRSKRDEEMRSAMQVGRRMKGNKGQRGRRLNRMRE
jgi:hypothetical protein